MVILDTAGRLHVDDELMAELERVAARRSRRTLLVLDAMTGQEAVNVALAFQERVARRRDPHEARRRRARRRGAVGARGHGAARQVRPVGEKVDPLEYFLPERMASRILGMGDVMTLIEKAEAAVEIDEQAEMEKRIRAGEFTFDDFLASYRMLRKMGPLQGVMKLIPGWASSCRGSTSTSASSRGSRRSCSR